MFAAVAAGDHWVYRHMMVSSDAKSKGEARHSCSK